MSLTCIFGSWAHAWLQVLEKLAEVNWGLPQYGPQDRSAGALLPPAPSADLLHSQLQLVAFSLLGAVKTRANS